MKVEKELERAVVSFLWKNDWKNDKGQVLCYNTNKNLGMQPNFFQGAHILSKQAHPELRLHRLNIIPLSSECHIEFDNEARLSMNVYKYVKTIYDMLHAHSRHIINTSTVFDEQCEYRNMLHKSQCYSNEEVELIIQELEWLRQSGVLV